MNRLGRRVYSLEPAYAHDAYGPETSDRRVHALEYPQTNHIHTYIHIHTYTLHYTTHHFSNETTSCQGGVVS